MPDCSYTWSYAIWGTSEADTYSIPIYNLIKSSLMEKEESPFGRWDPISDRLKRILIERVYNELVELVIEQKSRLAYQVFGVILMSYGAKMTDDVRALILKHSRWEDEQHQLKDPKDRSERLFYLTHFRDQVKNYREGVKTIALTESSDDVVQKLRRQGIITTNYPFITPPRRTLIDHAIRD